MIFSFIIRYSFPNESGTNVMFVEREIGANPSESCFMTGPGSVMAVQFVLVNDRILTILHNRRVAISIQTRHSTPA